MRKDLHLTWPRAETPTTWAILGMDEDLTKATKSPCAKSFCGDGHAGQGNGEVDITGLRR